MSEPEPAFPPLHGSRPGFVRHEPVLAAVRFRRLLLVNVCSAAFVLRIRVPEFLPVAGRLHFKHAGVQPPKIH